MARSDALSVSQSERPDPRRLRSTCRWRGSLATLRCGREASRVSFAWCAKMNDAKEAARVGMNDLPDGARRSLFRHERTEAFQCIAKLYSTLCFCSGGSTFATAWSTALVAVIAGFAILRSRASQYTASQSFFSYSLSPVGRPAGIAPQSAISLSERLGHGWVAIRSGSD
eukprot:1822065-Prymnesium_polylepis.2